MVRRMYTNAEQIPNYRYQKLTSEHTILYARPLREGSKGNYELWGNQSKDDGIRIEETPSGEWRTVGRKNEYWAMVVDIQRYHEEGMTLEDYPIGFTSSFVGFTRIVGE